MVWCLMPEVVPATDPPRLFWAREEHWQACLEAHDRTAKGRINAFAFNNGDGKADVRDRIFVPEATYQGLLDGDPEATEDKSVFHEALHCLIPDMHPPADSFANIVKGIVQAAFVYRFDCRCFTSLLTFRWGPKKHLAEFEAMRAAWRNGVNVKEWTP